MKRSQFNKLDIHDGSTILSNVQTGAAVALSTDELDQYRRGNGSAMAELTQLGFFVDDALDEFAGAMQASETADNTMNRVVLVIAPTIACNLECTYCYEVAHDPGGMSDLTRERVVGFASEVLDRARSAGGNPNLEVVWYGGEPLLGMRSIVEISGGLRSRGVMFNASMITNGYLLSKARSTSLADLGVSLVQVTIAGSRSAHDILRPHKGGRPSYDRILDNLQSADPRLELVLHVNVNRTNVDSLPDVIADLERRKLLGRVVVELRRIVYPNTRSHPLELSDIEFGEASTGFYARVEGAGRGASPQALEPIYGFCDARGVNNWVIGPRGDLYKCWEEIGDGQFEVGSIYDDRWKALVIDPRFDVPSTSACHDCALFPACLGGCPKRAIDAGAPVCIAAGSQTNGVGR